MDAFERWTSSFQWEFFAVELWSCAFLKLARQSLPRGKMFPRIPHNGTVPVFYCFPTLPLSHYLHCFLFPHRPRLALLLAFII